MAKFYPSSSADVHLSVFFFHHGYSNINPTSFACELRYPSSLFCEATRHQLLHLHTGAPTINPSSVAHGLLLLGPNRTASSLHAPWPHASFTSTHIKTHTTRCISPSPSYERYPVSTSPTSKPHHPWRRRPGRTTCSATMRSLPPPPAKEDPSSMAASINSSSATPMLAPHSLLSLLLFLHKSSPTHAPCVILNLARTHL